MLVKHEITTMFIVLFLMVAFTASIPFLKSKPSYSTDVLDLLDTQKIDLYDPVLEGKAKALLIKELTGREFTPEVARWANVTITGTTISIDTEKLNVWLGRNWESK